MQTKNLFTSWNAETPSSEIVLIACTDYLSVAPLHSSTIFYNLFKDSYKLKNPGNIVPPYQPKSLPTEFSSQLEYLVDTCQIQDLVILGHTQCPFLKTQLEQEQECCPNGLSNVLEWMKRHYPHSDANARLNIFIQENILCQIENLLTYPFVQKGIEKGQLKLRGLVHQMEKNKLFFFNNDIGQFTPVNELLTQSDTYNLF